MMLAVKGVKKVKPPNEYYRDFDEVSKDLITKGLINADFLTTSSPMCIRMCPNYTAATFAQGNCITPAEIRRKYRKEQKQDNILAYFNIDGQVHEIQDGIQEAFKPEAWYAQYTKDCRAKFGSVEKDSFGDDHSLKKSRRSVFTLMFAGKLKVVFQKPTIVCLRVPDDVCWRLADSPRRPKIDAPFNAEYVQLNQEYLGLDNSSSDEIIAALRVPDDDDADPGKSSKVNAPVKKKNLKLSQENLGLDSSGSNETIVAPRIPDDEFVPLAAPAKRPKLDCPVNRKNGKLNQEYFGFGKSGTDKAIAAFRVPDGGCMRFADTEKKSNNVSDSDNSGGGADMICCSDSVSDEGMGDDEEVRGGEEVEGDEEVRGGEEVEGDDEVRGGEEVEGDEKVEEHEEIGADAEVGNEEEMEVDLFADGSADDLFPDF